MRKVPLALSILSFLLAAAVLLFADGFRSVYGAVFFVVIGAVLLANARPGTTSASG
jgi:hypothetical protein